MSRLHPRLESSRALPPIALTILISAWLALPVAPAGAATPTADYDVVFDATWSEETHPGTLPPGPHFSPLIGGLHDGQVHFWRVGELASDGIEDMAEYGSTSPLDSEVNTAIGAGTANLLLSGGGLGSPDSTSMSFTADEDFPLVTLVSMLAPSPDWFVGVDSLSLMNGGDWLNQIVVPLHVYDAGTDSGTNFTSGDQDTNPADPISVFDTGVFAPPMQFVGTFTITRTDAPPPEPMPVPLLVGVVPQTILPLALGAMGLWRVGARNGAARA